MSEEKKWELPKYNGAIPKLVFDSVHQLNEDGSETDITEKYKGGFPKFEEPIISKEDLREALKIMKEENRPWIKQIEDYCTSQNITPEDLINAHRFFHR